MKKRTKLIALAMAAVVWIASMGTLLVYVLGKNSPFSGSSKFTGGKVVLSADKDIGNNLSQLIRESAYSSANDTVDSMTAFT
ncbi:MAG: hypothetical protein MJ132_06860, partial [Clostridia bacterium]|nr:hypothetical protein [Clostridia bacterium]